MSSVRVCVCDCAAGYNTKRLSVPFSQTEKTDSLLTKIGQEIGLNQSDFEAVYCGHRIDGGSALNSLNLTSQSTVYVYCKPPPAQPSKDAPSPHLASELIQKAVQRPNYKKTVDHIMTSQDSLHKLLTAVPGLDKDPTAISMLQDPELLAMLTRPSDIHKVLKQHPLFGKAAVYIAGVVNEEHARDPSKPARSNVYSLDRMSDEEDEGNQQPRGASGSGSQHQITQSQVAAALAAAMASAAARPSTSQQGAVGGSASGAGLMSDFHQQSRVNAHNTALEAQLQQLRDMGITDETVARQALNATNGDLQAALDLIFGDGNM